MEAYVGGISTRKVDALVAALGVQSGISKSQVSCICADIDVQVQAFQNRPLEETGYAYVYLDATYLHGRLGKALHGRLRRRQEPAAAGTKSPPGHGDRRAALGVCPRRRQQDREPLG